MLSSRWLDDAVVASPNFSRKAWNRATRFKPVKSGRPLIPNCVPGICRTPNLPAVIRSQIAFHLSFVHHCDRVSLWFKRRERCAYEQASQGDCSSSADFAGRRLGRCVSDSWGNGISSVLASPEGELDGSLCAAGNCGSASLADRSGSGGPGAVSRGEETGQGG